MIKNHSDYSAFETLFNQYISNENSDSTEDMNIKNDESNSASDLNHIDIYQMVLILKKLKWRFIVHSNQKIKEC